MSTTESPRPTEPTAASTEPTTSGAAPTASSAPPTSSVEPPSGIRASDAERERTVAHLHDALGEGRLDIDETDRRVATAYAATHREQLPPLVDDLPDGPSSMFGAQTTPSVTAAASWSEIWLLVTWRARLTIWGDGASAPPTPRHLRIAVLVSVLIVLWFLLCALVGAAAVA